MDNVDRVEIGKGQGNIVEICQPNSGKGVAILLPNKLPSCKPC